MMVNKAKPRRSRLRPVSAAKRWRSPSRGMMIRRRRSREGGELGEWRMQILQGNEEQKAERRGTPSEATAFASVSCTPSPNQMKHVKFRFWIAKQSLCPTCTVRVSVYQPRKSRKEKRVRHIDLLLIPNLSSLPGHARRTMDLGSTRRAIGSCSPLSRDDSVV